MSRLPFAFLLSLILGQSVLPAQVLSDAEADAIILAREQAKSLRQQARLSELDEATVKSEGRGTLQNGQEVIVREVAPPENVGASFYDAPPSPKPEQKTLDVSDLSPEQLTQYQKWQARAAKEHQVVMLSATVYEGEVTRLSWRHGNEAYVAYTNADFNYLRGVHSLATETHDFSYFTGIGDATRADDPYPAETVPPASAFSPGKVDFMISEGNPEDSEATAGITALLAHYGANLPQLKIERQRREALSAARKRYDAKNPKQLEPFIMQFWVPEPAESAAANDSKKSPTTGQK